jgi:hypothetical protein
MSWELVKEIVRQDLEATTPPDAEILARFRRAKREAPARSRSFFGPVQFGMAGLAVAFGALFFWSTNQGSTGFNVRVTGETWQSARKASEQKADSVIEIPAPQDEVSEPALKDAEEKEVPRRTKPKSVPSKAPAPSALSAAPRWEDVAQAMRTGDESRARELIVQLRQSDDAETRDNARLAEVQMNIVVRDGKRTLSPAQMATLQDLRATGATSSIRAAARRLLAQVEGASRPGADEVPGESGLSPPSP